MAKAVKIPVTVKMRAGWNDKSRNAPELARMVAGRRRRGGDHSWPDRGAVVHRPCRLGPRGARRRTAHHSGARQWRLHRTASRLSSAWDRCPACSSDGACCGIRGSWLRRRTWPPVAPARTVTLAERGQFLLDYIELLVNERVDEAAGFRHVAPTWRMARPYAGAAGPRPRTLGHQQSARADVVVFEGPRRRFTRCECGSIPPRASRSCATSSTSSSSRPNPPAATSSSCPPDVRIIDYFRSVFDQAAATSQCCRP